MAPSLVVQTKCLCDRLRTHCKHPLRKLRQLGYLEPGIDAPIATGYDPLLDGEPELARSMAA